MAAKTRTDRVKDVRTAARHLPLMIRAAEHAEKTLGADHPETLVAWAAVETAGATVHRQARLLAGKPRGG